MTEPRAYYNELDPYCADWLRNLINANLIAPGDVDTRDIRDIVPTDLAGYTQCHFFAGIGGWSAALRLAAVPDHFPLWTGSCPCQPFSQAGRRLGFADERHLWPHWFHLIQQCRPAVVFGEQVANPDGLAWLDLVAADLENADYRVGASDLCAAGVGAPHIRQRLWFVAKPCGGNACAEWEPRSRQQRLIASNGIFGVELGNAFGEGLARRSRQAGHDGSQQPTTERAGGSVRSVEHAPSKQMGLPGCSRLPRETVGDLEHAALDGRQQRRAEPGERGLKRGCGENFWSAAEWISCTDGKARPVEPRTFPLAYGVPARVAKLRALGNAIVPQVAAQFIKAALDL